MKLKKILLYLTAEITDVYHHIISSITTKKNSKTWRDVLKKNIRCNVLEQSMISIGFLI